ncbi:tetratricopeptide repeat protein, partial [Marinobacterium sedimentorum]|uniref:tetratricopeptide repeat protein n=1 Tax=Marinobacterium sedimentorum TaxID=2927804 RepID=UPI0020C60D8D
LCETALATQPEHRGALLGRADNALQRGDQAAALAHVEAALEIRPDDRVLLLKQAAVLQAMQRYDMAAALLKRLHKCWPGDTGALTNLASVLRATGQEQQAISLLEESLELNPHSILLLSSLLDIYEFRSNDDRYLQLLVRLAGLEHSGQSSRLCKLVEAYEKADDFGTANKVIDELITKAKKNLIPPLPWLLIDRNRADDALRVIRGWVHQNPDDKRTAQIAAPALNVIGGEALEDLEVLRLKMPDAFEIQGYSSPDLRNAMDGDPNIPMTIPINNLRAAWSVTDQNRYEFESWARAARRATTRWRMFVSTFASSPETLDLLDEYIDTPELDELEALADKKRPFIIVSSHFGPPATLWYFTKRFPELHYFMAARSVASVGNPSLNPIRLDYTRPTSARKIIDILKTGAPIIVANDVHHNVLNKMNTRSAANGSLFGKPYAVSPIVPKISAKYGLPTYWVQSFFVQGRITFELERLPDPLPSEDMKTWCDRWATSYLGKFEKVMTGDPENLNLLSPVWNYLQD